MTRYLTFTDGASAKFWEVRLEGHNLITRYGKIGTDGKSLVKSFDSPEQARVAMDKQTREKLGKGYEELDEATTAKIAADAVYLEHQTRFFEITEGNNQMRIRRGEIGKPCLEYRLSWITPNRGRKTFERLVKTWKGQGFKVTQPITEILEGSVAGQLWTNEILDHPVYAKFFDLGWGGELRNQVERLIHFPNGLQYDGDFDLEEIADMELSAGLIIEGDVRVSGVFSQLTYTYPGSTLIMGNIYAHSLGHKDSHMRINGDVHVENVVYGEYNDGSLEIAGDVYGRAWINADHNMWAGGTYHLPTFHDETKGLSPKILTLEGRLDWDALRECIFARKSPLRKDFVFIPPEPEPLIEEAKTSELYKQVRALAEAEDVEGLTQLLETWQERDHEWQEFVQVRLVAPSSTPEQQKRLRAVLELPTHEQHDVAELFRRHYPDTNIWTIPASGQVQEPEEAHPKILELLNLPDWEEMLEALETPPDEDLIQSHSWFLLVNLVRRTDALDDDYINVIERLLKLKADPRVSFEGMNMSVVQQAERLDSDAVLALFYRQYPELRPEQKPEDTVYGSEVLNKLIQLEDAGTGFEDAEIKRNWLEPVFQLSVIVVKVKRIPESLGKLQSLKTLTLGMIEPNGLELPASLADLVNLENLILGGSGFTDLPDLSGLTKLKKLALFGNNFKRLATFPVNLEQLTLDRNPFEESPNLSALTNLKYLSLNGVKVIPIGLESLVNLEGLVWTDANLDTLPDTVTRLPKLRHLLLSGNHLVTLPDLRDLHELEILDLQNCRLERLPEGLLGLPKLKRLLFSGNPKLEKLIKKTKDAASLEILGALRARGVTFTTENPEDSEESETKKRDTLAQKSLKQIQKLNKRAYDFQTAQPSNYTKAVEHYESVLEISPPFLTDSHEGFDYQYLLLCTVSSGALTKLQNKTQPKLPKPLRSPDPFSSMHKTNSTLLMAMKFDSLKLHKPWHTI
jgi:predicted DNA-binding WGR domain protein